ncbi:MAG: hypothetical protein GY859_34250 [Desulfobacterales bacterium]|nr:hypothetical protein [Desulfobacterales bacterium]
MATTEGQLMQPRRAHEAEIIDQATYARIKSVSIHTRRFDRPQNPDFYMGFILWKKAKKKL